MCQTKHYTYTQFLFTGSLSCHPVHAGNSVKAIKQRPNGHVTTNVSRNVILQDKKAEGEQEQGRFCHVTQLKTTHTHNTTI